MHFLQPWFTRNTSGCMLVEWSVVTVELQKFADSNVLIANDYAMIELR